MLQVKEEDTYYLEDAEFVEVEEVLDENTIEETSSKPSPVIKEAIEHIVWTTAATKLFLSLYKEGRDQVNTGEFTSKKDLWYYISNEMGDRGYNISAVQAENKLKTLERAYKSSLINRELRVPSIFGVESELAELFGHRMDMDPLETAWTERKPVMLWTNYETKAFLALYKDTQELLTTGRVRCKRNLWALIANKMQQQGYAITAVQAENKYKTLERAYKKSIINKKFSINARVRSTCGLEKELDELFGGKPYQPNSLTGRLLASETLHIEPVTPSPPPPQPPPQPPLSPLSPLSPIKESSKTCISNSSPSRKIKANDSTLTSNKIKDKNKDGITAQLLQMVGDSISHLTRKMDEQLENQRRFIAAQEVFQKNILEQQRKMHLERRRKNDLLEEFLRRKYE